MQIAAIVKGSERTWMQAWQAAYEIAFLRGGCYTKRELWGWSVWQGAMPCKMPQ